MSDDFLWEQFCRLGEMLGDGDLPKETGEYLTNIGVLIWDYYADGRYGWHTEICEFCDCYSDVNSDEIIAWCEIPKE